MPDLQVLVLRGLPASGKTTYANGLLSLEDEQWTRVSARDICQMLYNRDFYEPTENVVLETRGYLILKALENGSNVVLDDCHLDNDDYYQIKSLVGDRAEVGFGGTSISVPVETCIARDLKRPNSIGHEAIRAMYNSMDKHHHSPFTLNRPDLPGCILVGLDDIFTDENNPVKDQDTQEGYTSFREDTLDTVKTLASSNEYRIVILGHRPESDELKAEVTSHLNKAGIEDFDLYLGGNPQFPHGFIFLTYTQKIKATHNVKMVFSGDLKNVDWWKSMKIPAFYV